MKYIVMEDEVGVRLGFLFPEIIHHDAFAESIEGIRNQTYGNWERIFRKPVSAGFYNEGRCYGQSETLGLTSNKTDIQYFK